MLIKPVAVLSACLAIATFCTLSAAQQATSPSDSDSSSSAQSQQAPAQSQPSATQPAQQSQNPSPDKDKEKEKDEKKDPAQPQTSNDRLFYALPNFISLENRSQAPPLTAKQKYALVARGSFDPVQYPWWAFLAGLSQAQNSEPGFGQGAAGYGKRYATAVADGLIENFMTGAVLPSLLKQDPRYFQMGHGSFGHRLGYSMSRIVVTRNDNGKNGFNYSEVVGSGLSSAISTFSYHPTSTYLSTPTNPHMFIPSDRTLKNAASVWGTQVGYDTLTLAIREFWPDIRRAISRKHRIEGAAPISPATPANALSN